MGVNFKCEACRDTGLKLQRGHDAMPPGKCPECNGNHPVLDELAAESDELDSEIRVPKLKNFKENPVHENLKRRPGFKEIPVADGSQIKCNSILEFKGTVYVATDQGVYVVKDDVLHEVKLYEAK